MRFFFSVPKVTEENTTPRKGALLFFLKASISLGLLVMLFSRMDLGQFFRAGSSTKLSYLCLATVAYGMAKLISAARWALLSRPLGFRASAKKFAAFYFIGMFFNLFAPSALGGDAGRAIYLSRDEVQTPDGWKTLAGRALVSVAADRIIGLAILIWIGCVGLLVFPFYTDSVPWLARYLLFGAALGFVFAYFLLRFADSFVQRAGFAVGGMLLDTLQLFRSNPGLMVQAVLLSVLIHLIQTWIQILLGRALGFYIPWSYCFIFFPLVDMLSMLPLSVSGIGLREGGYLFFLGKLGIAGEKAVACGMLWFIVVLLNGLIGGLVFLLYRRDS